MATAAAHQRQHRAFRACGASDLSAARLISLRKLCPVMYGMYCNTWDVVIPGMCRARFC